MKATQDFATARRAAIDTLSTAADAHHAIRATARALADAIYAQCDVTVVGMYEALCFSLDALDGAIGGAMEQVADLPDPNAAHGALPVSPSAASGRTPRANARPA
jgi:hypothetical protein